MAINKNHEFEELNGIKCAIVERNVSQERVDFLKDLLEFNRFTVVVVPTAVKPVPASAAGTHAATAPQTGPITGAAATPPQPAAVPPPPVATFTIGVTDVSFNWVNAIFGRLLKTRDGHIVTLAYWQQNEPVSKNDVPYFGNVVNP